MRIIVRVDASVEMGTGHVMRCLTLAGRLKEEGALITFICRELPGNLLAFIESQEFKVHPLPAPKIDESSQRHQSSTLTVDWQLDAQQTAEALAREGAIDWLIVDHYALDQKWESLMRPGIGKIMVVDDLADRPHDCDLLLDQNLYENLETRYQSLVPLQCQKLLGPRYALLRPEFLQERQMLRERNGVIRRILISFGGNDATNETAKALEAIRMLQPLELAVDVVVGQANPHRKGIEAFCATLPTVSFHCQINNMAELMAAADLAIGAGGSTTWERCCLGLPGLMVAVAFNQEALARHCCQAGVAKYLGVANKVTTKILSRELSALMNDRELVGRMSAAGYNLVDGRGVERVLQQMHHKDLAADQAERGPRISATSR